LLAVWLDWDMLEAVISVKVTVPDKGIATASTSAVAQTQRERERRGQNPCRRRPRVIPQDLSWPP